MNKKKYLGGLKAFLLLLFIMLLGFCSTSYASTPTNEANVDYMQALMNSISNTIYNLTNESTYRSKFKAFYNNANIENLVETWNNNINTEIFPTFEQLSITIDSQSSTIMKIILFQNNNGYGDSLPFVGIRDYNDNRTTYNNYYMENGTTFTSGYRQDVILNTNGTFTFSTPILLDTAPTNYTCIYPINTSNKAITYLGESFVNLPNVISYKNQTFNITRNNWATHNWYYNTNVIGYTFPEEPPYNPDEPSGDTSGENTTGQITNPSGEVTGQIDLTNIENSLGRIEEKIPSSGDISIAVGQAYENYWGSGESLSGDVQKDLIENSINEIMANLSGDLLQNSVFSEMENVENIFLDFFRNQEDESFYDLIISWDTISPVISMYNGSVTVSSSSIISGDSINFSALCRNNSTLSQIQQYIRIIFNFSCTIALVWQVYNLILSTLGIDNPYLYEDSDITDVVNPSTGENYTRVKAHWRVFRKWW